MQIKCRGCAIYLSVILIQSLFLSYTTSFNLPGLSASFPPHFLPPSRSVMYINTLKNASVALDIDSKMSSGTSLLTPIPLPLPSDPPSLSSSPPRQNESANMADKAYADGARNASHRSLGSMLVTSADQLSYLQTMTAGALSRTMAQTLLHPAHTYKTLLQLKDQRLSPPHLSFPPLSRLLRGVDAQFLLSLPHGAFHFFVIDQVKLRLQPYLNKQLDFVGDFLSSALSTVICSVISTPQMVLTDRLMAGLYDSMSQACESIYRTEGWRGFYSGWWPALAQKIPSYGLTWMFFQQLKKTYIEVTSQPPSSEMNFILGALAAAGSVTVMIPMDTIKTRLVIQAAGMGAGAAGAAAGGMYKGVADCFVRIVKEEGVGALYRSLPPRLVSVVPMIAIQFGVYEGLKSQFMHRNLRQRLARARSHGKKK